jgi:hypothetical protein
VIGLSLPISPAGITTVSRVPTVSTPAIVCVPNDARRLRGLAGSRLSEPE